jgi:putative methionine-R-sulfoxide reductase with GAF domain
MVAVNWNGFYIEKQLFLLLYPFVGRVIPFKNLSTHHANIKRVMSFLKFFRVLLN